MVYFDFAECVKKFTDNLCTHPAEGGRKAKRWGLYAIVEYMRVYPRLLEADW
jgi:hypothetical protein